MRVGLGPIGLLPGSPSIRAVVVEDRSADLLRLMEIDENPVRAELSPAERAAHHAERKKIYEREFPQTRHVTERGGPGRGNKTPAKKSAVSCTAEAAEKTGTSERTVRREVARGAIPYVIALAGTALADPPEYRLVSLLHKTIWRGRRVRRVRRIEDFRRGRRRCGRTGTGLLDRLRCLGRRRDVRYGRALPPAPLTRRLYRQRSRTGGGGAAEQGTRKVFRRIRYC